MLSLNGTYENGVITLDDDSVIKSLQAKVIVTFLEEVNSEDEKKKSPVKYKDNVEISSISEPTAVAVLELPTTNHSKNSDTNPDNSDQEMVFTDVDRDFFRKLIKEAKEDRPKNEMPEKKFRKYSDFSWAKSQEKLKHYKGLFSMSEEVIAERREDL